MEFRQSLGMNFVSLKGSSKCTIHKNVHKLYAVHHSMFLRLSISISNFLKLLNKLYNELGEKKHHLSYSYNGKSSFVK